MSFLHSLLPFEAIKRVAVTLGLFFRQHRAAAILTMASIAVVAYFYGFVPYFGAYHDYSALGYLAGSWNERTGYDHGFVGPFLIAFLLLRRLPEVAEAPWRPAGWGIAFIIFGVLTYLVAIRTLQYHVAVGGLPFLILGGIAWAHSWRAARLLAFPIFVLYFLIPVPGLIQATNGLQLLATKAAYSIATFAGIDAVLSGNDINSVPAGKWGFNIAEGCSGVRSLVALTLIGAVYAHLTQRELWKKLVIFACSFPLAIIGNCLRVASILFVAEYISPDFASKSYHGGSGFIFFLVVGLAGLSLCDWLLNHAGRSRVVTRRVSTLQNASTPPAESAS
ncbi:MAG: exosortase/archaeosortase family protein [Verrucomicrobiales bacterium]